MFGLGPQRVQVIADALTFEVRPGQVGAVVGPSGAGKSVLLREVAKQIPAAKWLRIKELSQSARPAVSVVGCGDLGGRLAALARCGLAEAQAVITPARLLSGGQLYRLALAEAICAATSSGTPSLVLADEFGAVLDTPTAVILCRQLRRLLSGAPVALLLATPRWELIGAVRPDVLIVKPLGRPAHAVPGPGPWRRGAFDPAYWPITRGSIHDYHALASFHYLSRPPAAHKRVYVIRPPGLGAGGRWGAGGCGRSAPSDGKRQTDRVGQWACLPDPAAVLVVSPPLIHVPGREPATGPRYAGPDAAEAVRRLNREVECISRVIVHPVFRGSGLAVRLVRRALATAEAPLMEALAAMGRICPFFERAGMTAYTLAADQRPGRRRRPGALPYVYYLARAGKGARRSGWDTEDGREHNREEAEMNADERR